MLDSIWFTNPAASVIGPTSVLASTPTWSIGWSRLERLPRVIAQFFVASTSSTPTSVANLPSANSTPEPSGAR